MRGQGRVFGGAAGLGAGSLGEGLAARADALAAAGAERPGRALALLAAGNALAAAVFVACGLAAGDQALFFRELMPGTWLSFAQLAFVAWVAHRIHASAGAARRRADFWGLASAVFCVLAADEILQVSQFLGTWLNQDAGLTPASGFNDLGAVILTLLFAGCALALLPRALVLLRHPPVLALLAAATALGAGSQALDSFVEPTRWEFVAEETLKLGAEALFVAALLVAFRRIVPPAERAGPIGPPANAEAAPAEP